MATTLVRIQLLSKSGSEFATINPVLLNGEMGIADTGSSKPVAKVGDGVRPWTALPELTPWGLFNWDSHITGDWIFDATQFFGFTPAEVLDIKSAPGLWQSDGSDAIHAESRVVIAARNAVPTLVLRHVEGTSYAAPTPIPFDSVLGQVRFVGSRGAGLAPALGALISSRALNVWNAGSSPAYIEVACVPSGSTLEQTVASFAAQPAYNELTIFAQQGRGVSLHLEQFGVARWQLQSAANSANLTWVTFGNTICLTLTPAGALTATNNVRSQTWLQGDTGVGDATLANALTWNAATYLYGSASLKGARNGYVGLALEAPNAPTFMAGSTHCGVFLQTPGRWAWSDDGSVFQVSLPMALPGASLAGAAPALIWNETDVAANNKLWRVAVDNKVQSFQVGTDAGVYATWLQASRTGNVVDAIALTATALTFNGTPVSLVGHTHSGADITSGTIADARLSENVVLTNDPRLSVFTAVKSGIAPQSGGGALNFLRADGAWAAPAGAGGAGTPGTPTAKVGLLPVIGVANTFTPSDSAPALDVAIVPTWIGLHTFSQKIISTVVANSITGAYGLSIDSAAPFWHISETTATADNRRWQFGASAEQLKFSAVNDAGDVHVRWLTVDRTGVTIDQIALNGPVAINGAVQANTACTVNCSANQFGFVVQQPQAGSGANALLHCTNGIDANFDVQISMRGAASKFAKIGTLANVPLVFIENNIEVGRFDSSNFTISTGNLVLGATNGGIRGANGNRGIDFAPSFYGTLRVFALDGGLNGHIGVQLGTALNTTFMGNGTNEGIYIPGDTKWLIYRSSPTTGICGYAMSGPSFTPTSSRTIKRETGAPTNVRDILARLRPILYRLLEGYDVEQLGLIAEEVHEVCPYLSPDGTSVAYDRLAVLLLADWQSRYAHVA
jgi:hypothetical protein